MRSVAYEIFGKGRPGKGLLLKNIHRVSMLRTECSVLGVPILRGIFKKTKIPPVLGHAERERV